MIVVGGPLPVRSLALRGDAAVAGDQLRDPVHREDVRKGQFQRPGDLRVLLLFLEGIGGELFGIFLAGGDLRGLFFVPGIVLSPASADAVARPHDGRGRRVDGTFYALILSLLRPEAFRQIP